ncbi:MAG: biopolymer transporter ExbD [Verrucomicrobiota bacterium]
MPHKRRQPPSVIIVSLIDVLIVVLIFLMVTTTFKQRQPAVKLALPESKQSKPGSASSSHLVVTVAKAPPYYYLDTLPVTAERLEAELTARAKQDPALTLSIRADDAAPFGKIVAVMDAAKAADIKMVDAFVKAPTAK